MVTALSTPYQFKASPHSSHALLLDCLPPVGHGRRILDVGCAGGYLGEILASRGYRVTGIDTPGTAQHGFPGHLDLIEADLDLGLPHLPGNYDVIVCADILEHLKRPDALLRQLRELLGYGGRLIASLPNSGHAYFRWNILRGRFPAEDRGLFDRTHLHFYTWSGWAQLFAGAGLKIELVRCSGVPIGLAVPKWQNTMPVRAAERLSFEAARLWKTMFAYQFIVTTTSGDSRRNRE